MELQETPVFKNLMLYRVGPQWPARAAELEQALQREPFAPCSPSQQKSSGWVSPRGLEHGALVEVVDGQWLACLAIETKSVPADAVRQKAQEAADAIEREHGRTPGKKEMRDLREDALQALLPQAFARRVLVRLWLHPEQRWLMLDAGSQARADEVISSLVRVADTGFSIALLQTQRTPQSAMTNWLGAPLDGSDAGGLPDAWTIGRECELKASGEEPAVVRFARHELRTEEVRQHVAEGKLPTRLALNWQGRIDLLLTQALQLKRIRFDSALFDEQAGVPTDERFDADMAIATSELAALIGDLVEALDGEMPLPGEQGLPQPATAADDSPPF